MSLFAGSGNNGTEAKSDRLGLPTGTSDPGSAEAGDMYYNTSEDKVKYYDGSSWKNLQAPDPFLEATGGTLTYYTSGNTRYAVHSFLSTGLKLSITQLASGANSNMMSSLLAAVADHAAVAAVVVV